MTICDMHVSHFAASGGAGAPNKTVLLIEAGPREDPDFSPGCSPAPKQLPRHFDYTWPTSNYGGVTVSAVLGGGSSWNCRSYRNIPSWYAR